MIAGPAPATSASLTIVAAENFYGDVIRQLAGPGAQVLDVLSNPDADPHLFEVNASTARAVSMADLVVYNGLQYDPWMTMLTSTARQSSRHRIIMVATVVNRDVAGVNPHLWYDPATMPMLARAVVLQLRELDPDHALAYEQRLQQFLDSMRQIDGRIAAMRQRYEGLPVAAAEPVSDYLTNAIGLVVRDQRFALATMNGTEPSARDTAEFERQLATASVRALIYNRQATNSAVARLLGIARDSGVPVVGVTETQPPGVSYQRWMLNQLGVLDRALAGHKP